MSLSLWMYFWNSSDWVAAAAGTASMLTMLGIGLVAFFFVGVVK